MTAAEHVERPAPADPRHPATPAAPTATPAAAATPAAPSATDPRHPIDTPRPATTAPKPPAAPTGTTPTGTTPTNTPQPIALHEATPALHAAIAAGDAHRIGALVQNHALQMWFGAGPEELARAAPLLGPETRRAFPLAHAVAQLIEGRAITPPSPTVAAKIGAETARRAIFTAAFQARLHGAARTASALMAEAEQSMPRRTVVMFDSTSGDDAFVAVEHGITLMLAGRFPQALGQFARATLTDPADLPFLTRDAHVKSAVIHAVFGSPRRARHHLKAASTIARTGSWIESVIDAHAALAEAALGPADESTIAALDALPLRAIGELWPMYVQALNTVCVRAGHPEEAAARIEMLRAASLPRTPGDGFAGSVFQTTLGFEVAMRGDIALAREMVSTADPEVVTTRMLTAFLDLLTGRAQSGLAELIATRPLTMGLPQLDVQRRMLLANAFESLGRTEDCIAVLKSLDSGPFAVLPQRRTLFSPGVLRLAREHLTGWDATTVQPVSVWDHAVVLTTREREILTMLAAGRTREQMAAELFVSANTVKSHQRSLFRKLGASTRADAVAIALQRALI